MALEIPQDLIRKLQLSTREQAGVPQYDPDDQSLLQNFPTLRDSIAGLDPSAPTYLRCKHCHGKFLRGLQSMVCVYCGAEQRRNGLPQTISFNATAGYRWLLESLDLDPSEHVTLHSDSRDSRKSEGAVKVMFLSDLLDLEITWPSDKEEPERSAVSKMPCHSTPMDFSVSDLAKSVSEAKPLEVSGVSSVLKDGLQTGHVISTETTVLTENFGSFENIHSKETLQGSVEVENIEFGDSFADWEADFHSASSEIPAADSKTSVHFQSITSDTRKDSEGDFGFHGDGHSELSASKIDNNPPMNSDWIPDDLWHTAGIKISDSDTADRENISDDFLPVAAPHDSKEVHGTREKSDGDNDDWNNFTISQASSNSSRQIGENAKISVNDKKKNVNDFDSFDDQKNITIPQGATSDTWAHIGGESNKISNETNTLKETDFDGFLQSGPSSGTTPVKNGSMTDMFEDIEFGSFLQSGDSGPSGIALASAENDFFNKDGFQLKNANSERMINTSTAAAAAEEEEEDVKPESTSLPTVDVLLSQMNDLSFMLQDNLSIPSNTKNTGSSS